MPKIAQKPGISGSQKWLQKAVNWNPRTLDKALRFNLKLDDRDTIEWLSPLERDGYAEYRDEAFLDTLSVRLQKRSLESFWPNGGPVWDGLARTGRGDVILVEAKSHISEMASSCQARNPESRKLIERSLRETADFYGASSPGNWTDGYYQYANRLAHLHLLRNLNGIEAWLCFVCFVNDREMNGPTAQSEWERAIEDIHNHLGIKSETLRPYVIDLFVDVKEARKDSSIQSEKQTRDC